MPKRVRATERDDLWSERDCWTGSMQNLSNLHIHELQDATGQKAFAPRERVQDVRAQAQPLHRHRLIPLLDHAGGALVLPRYESKTQRSRDREISIPADVTMP